MKDVKITIITVCYNANTTIEQTICSVLNQTYKNIEYIIVDGGSTDGTLDILHKYSDKIKWVSEPDNGIYDAMNKGIKMASGDYIQFIGSDDCLINYTVIEKLVNKIDLAADVISAAEIVVEEDSKLEYYVGNSRGKKLIGGQVPWIPHAPMLTKTALMKKVLFDTRYKIAADYDFILKCFKDSSVRFQFIDMPLVYFSSSGISNNYLELAKEENLRIFKELGYEEPKMNILERIIRCFKETTKYLLNQIGLWTWGRCNFLGVKRHECDNRKCRWCNRHDEEV